MTYMLVESEVLGKLGPYLTDTRDVAAADVRKLFPDLGPEDVDELMVLLVANDIGLVPDPVVHRPSGKRTDERLSNTELCIRYQDGDPDAAEALVRKNVKFVDMIARKVAGVGCHDLSVEDLSQEGCMGMLRAAERFDASLGYSFLTYGAHWIRQAMYRAVANQGYAVRPPAHLHGKLSQIRKIRPAGEDLSPEELLEIVRAAGMDIDLGTLKHCLAYELAFMLMPSLDMECGGDDDKHNRTLGEAVACGGTSVEDTVLGTVGTLELKELVERLPRKQGRVILMRFGFDGPAMTLAEIGGVLGMTREGVRQLETRGLERLRKMMRVKPSWR